MENIIEMKNISIEFPGVKALDSVDFTTDNKTIHALIGANGAGKSTLMKVLSGAYSHYTGDIYINGEKVEIRSPKEAKQLGIEIVYQEVDTALIPYLSVAENVMFNSMINNMEGSFINWKKIKDEAQAVLKRMNVDIDISETVSNLTLAEKQMVLIARCIVEDCRFIILDEPTAPLSDNETKKLFEIVRELSNDGVGIIFISHRLNELYEICNDITILRDGKLVKNMPLNYDVPQEEIVECMLGKTLESIYESNRGKRKFGEEILALENLTEVNGKIKDINLSIREGEIIGIAGLVGAGKTELCKTIFGDYTYNGKIKMRGKEIKNKSPYNAVKNKLALVPEERRKEGVLVTDSVSKNLSISSLGKYSNFLSVVNKSREQKDTHKMIDDLGVVTPSPNQKVALLSGGNQQKVVVGKWLLSDAEIYIFDEPSKGIDVGSKQDMYKLIERVASEGKGVLYVTSEFNELLSICDKIYIMYDGKIVKEVNPLESSEKELLYYSTGGA